MLKKIFSIENEYFQNLTKDEQYGLNDKVLQAATQMESDQSNQDRSLSKNSSAYNEIEIEDASNPNTVSIVSTSVNCNEEENQLIKEEKLLARIETDSFKFALNKTDPALLTQQNLDRLYRVLCSNTDDLPDQLKTTLHMLVICLGDLSAGTMTFSDVLAVNR